MWPFKKKDKESFKLRVEKFSDIENKIVPFFIKYSIIGVKFQDFSDFCRVVELVKKKTFNQRWNRGNSNNQRRNEQGKKISQH